LRISVEMKLGMTSSRYLGVDVSAVAQKGFEKAAKNDEQKWIHNPGFKTHH